MPASLRFAQILLALGVAVILLVLVVIVVELGSTRGAGSPVPGSLLLAAVVTAGAGLYSMGRTVMALQRNEAWAPVAAFWGLGLFVLAGAVDLMVPAPGTSTIPLLGILALVALMVLPREAWSVRPREVDRRPPTRVTAAYLIVLVTTVAGLVLPPM